MTTFTRRIQASTLTMPDRTLAELANRARKLAHQGEPIGVMVLRQIRLAREARAN